MKILVLKLIPVHDSIFQILIHVYMTIRFLNCSLEEITGCGCLALLTNEQHTLQSFLTFYQSMLAFHYLTQLQEDLDKYMKPT